MNTSFLQIGDIIAVKLPLKRLMLARVLEITSNKISVKFQENEKVFIRKFDIHPIVLTDDIKKDLRGGIGKYDILLDLCNYLHEFQHILKIQTQNKRDTIEVDKIVHYNYPILDVKVFGKDLQNILVKYGNKIIDLDSF